MTSDFDSTSYLAGLEKLDMPQRQEIVAETVKNLDINEKKSTIVDATNSLSEADKKDVASRIDVVLALPNEKTNDWIWILIISAFVLVFMTTAGAMIFSLLSATEHPTAFDKLLIIFTTVVGFLVGLLSPSPVKKT